MKALFDYINNFFQFIIPISDIMWDFPTNFEWYSQIPILGNFSLAIILLVGSGIYFTFELKFIQVTSFKKGIDVLVKKKVHEVGVSPLTAFLLSSAMRIGPGNIMGVTGAISVGGPGAMFWMWVSAFFGMATSYVESVLAQIFKEKKDSEYVGGVPFYGKALLGGKIWVGNLLATILVVAFIFNVPGQTFHLFTSLGSVAELVTGTTYERTSMVYFAIAFLLMISTPLIIFGGIKRVTKITDIMVPIMSAIYCLMVIIIILLNFDMVPYFFSEVFKGAFNPRAILGGTFGVTLIQGVKRGLMSNEAGQGTITMAASVSDNDHPCEQGFVQSIGVFLDTMIICTLSGFMVVMAHLWTGESGIVWETIRDSKLTVYLSSVSSLVPGKSFDGLVQLIVSLSYALFAFTTLIGLISFAEISVNRISKNKTYVTSIRVLGSMFFVPFGCLTVLAGLELSNLWYVSDFTNILVVYANVPIILFGFNYVKKATSHYFETNGGEFYSRDILGIETDSWKNKLKAK